jgi:peptide/nickel transport system permease protein
VADGGALPETETWSDIVWTQFRRRTLPRAALAGVGVLLALAVYAPLIASNQPLLWNDATRGWSSPWLGSLFDRNFYANNIDVVFNSLLVFGSPLLVVAAALWRRAAPLPGRQRRARHARILQVVIAIWIGVTAALVTFPDSRPHVDWIEEHAALTTAGTAHTAIFPPIRSSHRDGQMREQFLAPDGAHWLGTDNEGRDVLARMLFGTRISLTVGLFAVSLYCTFGVLVGAVAGYAGGRVDLVIQWVIEVMLCVPTTFLLLGAAAFLRDRSIFHIVAIIAAVAWTTPARLVRAEFLKLRDQDFVIAAVSAGYTARHIVFREILPNAVSPVLVTATFGVGAAITLEATMSFLGLGDPSAPSWGLMLSGGREFGDWTMILAPSFAILVTVSLLNLVGEGLRDALDPKLRL